MISPATEAETTAIIAEPELVQRARRLASGLESLFERYKVPARDSLPTDLHLACPCADPFQAERYWSPHQGGFDFARYIDVLRHTAQLLNKRRFLPAWGVLINQLPLNSFILGRAIDLSHDLPHWNRSKYTFPRKNDPERTKLKPTPLVQISEYRLIHREGIVTLFHQDDLNFPGDRSFICIVESYGKTESCQLSYWGSGTLSSRKKDQETLCALEGDAEVLAHAQWIFTLAVEESPLAWE